MQQLYIPVSVFSFLFLFFHVKKIYGLTVFVFKLNQFKNHNKHQIKIFKSKLKASNRIQIVPVLYIHDLESMLVLRNSCTDMYLFVLYNTSFVYKVLLAATNSSVSWDVHSFVRHICQSKSVSQLVC